MGWLSSDLPAPEFGLPDGAWLHSPPMELADVRGKVVMVEIFDYSCINCLRTLPYLRRWRDRYGPQGFALVGVHSPEFPAGKNAQVVERALLQHHVDWPVLLDNDFEVWNRYGNQYWPTVYLIDPEGRLRYARVGEGAYDETERAIVRLLSERRG